MVFYVTIVIVWMTLFINKLTSIVMDDGRVAKTVPSPANNLLLNVGMDD